MNRYSKDFQGDPVNRGLWFDIGVLTIPVSTILALSLIPEEPSAPGALLWPMWVLTIGFLCGCIVNVITKGLPELLRAQHLLMVAIAIVVCSEPLQPWYQFYSDYESAVNTFLSIALFAGMAALGGSLPLIKLPPSIVRFASREYSARILFRIALLAAGLGLGSFAYAADFSISKIIDGLVASRFAAPWSRGQFGGWDAFRDFLGYFTYTLPTFTVLLAIRKKSWFRAHVLICAVCALGGMAFLAQSGGRRILTFVVGAAMITWFYVHRRRLHIRHHVAAIVMVVGMIVFLDFLLAHRTRGFRKISYTSKDFVGLKVDDNFRALSNTLRIIPAQTDFVGFQYVWYVLVRPVPRIFWSDKPVDYGFDLAKELRLKGVSIANSVIGEAYASFGWLGIAIAGIVFGCLAAGWSQLWDMDCGLIGAAVYALEIMAIFLGIRSSLEFVLMSYPLLCWYGLDFLFATSSESRVALGQPSHRPA